MLPLKPMIECPGVEQFAKVQVNRTLSIQIEITEDHLPVLSTVTTEALQLVNSGNVDNQKLEKLIRQDPSLTERILNIADSPFYAGAVQIRSIAMAVTRLDLRQLKKIILTAATGELFPADNEYVRGFWEHSLLSAVTTQNLSEAIAPELSEPAYIAGLLHDVGKMVIYQQHPEVYAEVIADAGQNNLRLHQAEADKISHFNHMSVGGLVIRKWGLGDDIAEAARFHHDVETETNIVLENMKLVCLTSLSSLIINSLRPEDPTVAPDELAGFACTGYLKIEPERFVNFLKRLRTDLLEMAA
jgi:putative nucleotidyltransferase with HDIG domain